MEPSAAQLFDLSSKVALVTGGAKGIGRGIAEALAAAGAAVAVADMDVEGANSVAQALQKRSSVAIAMKTNAADEESVKAMVQGVHAHFKHMNIIVNNAG